MGGREGKRKVTDDKTGGGGNGGRKGGEVKAQGRGGVCRQGWGGRWRHVEGEEGGGKRKRW